MFKVGLLSSFGRVLFWGTFWESSLFFGGSYCN